MKHSIWAVLCIALIILCACDTTNPPQSSGESAPLDRSSVSEQGQNEVSQEEASISETKDIDDHPPLKEEQIDYGLFEKSIYEALDTTEYRLGLLETELIGGWQRNLPWVGAGYDAIYLFLPDGTYIYTDSGGTRAERLRYHSGGWEVKDNVLIISTVKKKMAEGGIEVDGYASIINDIEGGELVTYLLNPPEIYEIPFDETSIYQDSSLEDWTVMDINGYQYYKINLSPFYLQDIGTAYASDEIKPY